MGWLGGVTAELEKDFSAAYVAFFCGDVKSRLAGVTRFEVGVSAVLLDDFTDEIGLRGN